MFSDFLLPMGANSMNSISYAIQTSDFVGQAIIVILVFGSVFTWIIMIEKAITLHRAKKYSEEFLTAFRDKQYPLHIFREAVRNPSPVARVYEYGAMQLLSFYDMPHDKAEFYGSDRYPEKQLNPFEIEAVRTALDKSVSDQILVIEERIGLLGTAVSVAPFLGLFGTVWGIMVAFCSLAQLGKASIGALAPGVSGALLTTVVGLVVAIPSLIGYNILTMNIRKITVYMDNFEEEFIAKIKLEQLSAKPAPRDRDR